jgi:hypothetical protein
VELTYRSLFGAEGLEAGISIGRWLQLDTGDRGLEVEALGVTAWGELKVSFFPWLRGAQHSFVARSTLRVLFILKKKSPRSARGRRKTGIVSPFSGTAQPPHFSASPPPPLQSAPAETQEKGEAPRRIRVVSQLFRVASKIFQRRGQDRKEGGRERERERERAGGVRKVRATKEHG